MTSSPDPQLIREAERIINDFAMWALLASYLEEHPPTAKMNPATTRVLLKDESWMIALFLFCRSYEPVSLCRLAKVLVEDCDVDRHKTARKALRDRYLPAFKTYELAQVTVTWVNGRCRFTIVATEKLVAFFSDRYLPACKSNDPKFLDAAAKEDPSDEGDPSDEV